MCNSLIKHLLLSNTEKHILALQLYSFSDNSGISAFLLFILYTANTIISSHLLGI